MENSNRQQEHLIKVLQDQIQRLNAIILEQSEQIEEAKEIFITILKDNAL
jgi:hypothetical protein